MAASASPRELPNSLPLQKMLGVKVSKNSQNSHLFADNNLPYLRFQDFKFLLSTVTPTGALVKTFNKSNTINIRGKLQALVLTTG